MKKWIWHLIGLMAGVFTVAAGIAVMASYAGFTPMTDVSGTDFYTYMYQAAAYGAYNTLMLARTVSVGFGTVLISMGLAEIGFFGAKFMAVMPEKKKKNQPENGPQPASSRPSLTGEEENAARAKLTGPTQQAEEDGKKEEDVSSEVSEPNEESVVTGAENTAEDVDPGDEAAEQITAENDTVEPAVTDLLSEAAEAEQALQDAVADAESAIRQAEEAASSLQE